MTRNLISSIAFAQALAMTVPSAIRAEIQTSPETTVSSVRENTAKNTAATLVSEIAGTHFVRETASLKDSPLFMKGVPRRIAEFLGYNQFERILEETNGIQGETDSKGRKVFNVSISNISEIRFPAKYPGLEKAFPEKLETEEDLVLVKTTEEWLSALGYYVSGKLRLATHVSLGKSGHKTPKWTFRSGYRESTKRSKRYENAPMPYAIHVEGHIFLHHGRVNWQGLSHGCVRVPGFYQEILFREMRPNTKIVIE